MAAQKGQVSLAEREGSVGCSGGVAFVLTLGVHRVPPPVIWQSEGAGRELASGQMAEPWASAWQDHSFGEPGDMRESTPQLTGSGRCWRRSAWAAVVGR